MQNVDSNDHDLDEDSFLPDFEDDFSQLSAKPRPLSIKVISVLMLISFLALALPIINLLNVQNENFLKSDPGLLDNPVVIASRNAVVSIEVQTAGSPTPSLRKGTGFCISSQGKIITNAHVIDGARTVKVIFGNGDTYFTKIYRTIEGTDLAVLQLSAQKLPYLSVDYESIVSNGDELIVIGNPLGSDRVSQQGRVGEYHLQSREGRIFDIAVSAGPGSSGSPVLNTKGSVIGVVYASSQIDDKGKTSTRALAIPLSPYKDQLLSKDW